jgi:hypothetical protein
MGIARRNAKTSVAQQVEGDSTDKKMPSWAEPGVARHPRDWGGYYVAELE